MGAEERASALPSKKHLSTTRSEATSGSGTVSRHKDDVPDDSQTAALKPDQNTACCHEQASKQVSELTACQKGFLTIKVRGVARKDTYPGLTCFGLCSIVANMVTTYLSKEAILRARQLYCYASRHPQTSCRRSRH